VTAPEARAGIQVATSRWGSDDQLGALNYVVPADAAEVLARADGRRVYDLSLEHFAGTPSFQAAGVSGAPLRPLAIPPRRPGLSVAP
jgi:hypothetical protein